VKKKLEGKMWVLIKTFEVESLFLWAFVIALEPTQKPREKDPLPL
jgi:hypothetical protein